MPISSAIAFNRAYSSSVTRNLTCLASFLFSSAKTIPPCWQIYAVVKRRTCCDISPYYSTNHPLGSKLYIWYPNSLQGRCPLTPPCGALPPVGGVAIATKTRKPRKHRCMVRHVCQHVDGNKKDQKPRRKIAALGQGSGYWLRFRSWVSIRTPTRGAT